MSRSGPKTIDVAEWFSPQKIGEALDGIYCVDRAQLMPAYDNQGYGPVCPISLQPFESPVLLEDGKVYEENQILRWMQSSNRAPSTNLALDHMNILRLKPMKTAIEVFLQRSDNNFSRPSLARYLREAIHSTRRPEARVEELEARIALAVEQAEELNETISRAQAALSNLKEQIDTERLLAVSRLRASVRSSAARRLLMSLAQAEHQQCFPLARGPQQWQMTGNPGFAAWMVVGPDGSFLGLVPRQGNAAPTFAMPSLAAITPEVPGLYRFQAFSCQHPAGFLQAPSGVGAPAHGQQGLGSPTFISDSSSSSTTANRSGAIEPAMWNTYRHRVSRAQAGRPMPVRNESLRGPSSSYSNEDWDALGNLRSHAPSGVGAAAHGQQGLGSPNVISDSSSSSTTANRSDAVEPAMWHTNRHRVSGAQTGRRMPVRNETLRGAGSGYSDEDWAVLGNLRSPQRRSNSNARLVPVQC